jgi:hypothetical protein
MREMVLGKNRERVRKMEVRVGAELAHMMRKSVQVKVTAKARKNAVMPLYYR